MANGIYKATLMQRWKGQQILNTLWYRSALEGTFATDLLIDGARALGLAIISHIWQAHWRAQKPADLFFDGVSVVGYNDMFELLYNNAQFIVPEAANTTGAVPVTEVWMPPGNCVNLAFRMKDRLITNPLFKPPAKGLVAYAPVHDSWAGNDGTLNDLGTSTMTPLATALSEPLPWDFIDIDIPFTNWQIGTGLPNAFIPMRAKVWQWDTPQIIGGVTVFKHIETADIDTCFPRKVLGYRRSRKVEG